MSNAGARPSARGVRGCRDRLRESGVARCGLLGLVGEGYGPCGRPAPPGAHVGRVLRLCGVTRGMVVEISGFFFRNFWVFFEKIVNF